MGALRWTTVVMAFAAAGSLVGFGISTRHPDAALRAYQALTGDANRNTPSHAALKFRQVDRCSIPVVREDLAFEGGLTSGERVTVRLDTDANTYQFRIEEAWHADHPSRFQSGHMMLDASDCTYVFGNDEPVRIAVNRDGVLFGMIENGATVPVRIVAFSSISNRLADLAGAWHILGEDYSASFDEARIRADGTFSKCSLTHASPMQCTPDTGRITLISNAFRATDAMGQGGTVVVGKAGDKTVPILLNRDNHVQGMRFLVRQSNAAFGQETQRRPSRVPQQHVQVVAPLFHLK